METLPLRQGHYSLFIHSSQRSISLHHDSCVFTETMAVFPPLRAHPLNPRSLLFFGAPLNQSSSHAPMGDAKPNKTLESHSQCQSVSMLLRSRLSSCLAPGWEGSLILSCLRSIRFDSQTTSLSAFYLDKQCTFTSPSCLTVEIPLMDWTVSLV